MPRPKEVITIAHKEDSRRNNPTAEMEAVMDVAQRQPIQIAYERRNRNLDPQLVWRGKDEQDLSDLIVAAPPLFTQEKVHPKALIDDLMCVSKQLNAKGEKVQQPPLDLFADFNGLHDPNARTEFYEHDQHWSNRMILGDSLQVMASLAEQDELRGKVQCIYIDPPYGIQFNSNFQWSTTSRDVKDGNAAHITREPEQVKAFRDTWREGIHSYLTYLRDRLTVARDLLDDTGSIFVQIGDENVHRVRAVMDEVFGSHNFVSEISFQKTGYATADQLPNLFDSVLFYAKNLESLKFRKCYFERTNQSDSFHSWDLASAGEGASTFEYEFQGEKFRPSANRHWKTQREGLDRAAKADRLFKSTNSLRYKRYDKDFSVSEFHNTWTDTISGSFHEPRRYVVETSPKVIQRCILMTTDPGDLILDPTCGSGTTAYVAEQWGRRWITIDTSRVALALARARIMGARYPYYLLADSRDGQLKEATISRHAPSEMPTYCNVRQGFVYERVPHITLGDIANNAEIDIIWEKYQGKLEPLREGLNRTLKTTWEEWEIPRDSEESWQDDARELHRQWWEQRIARQKEIDASIAANANFEYRYDKPYEDRSKVRVAGPFTVESLSPHRIIVSDDDEDREIAETGLRYRYASDLPERDFATLILDNLRTSGVQQAHKSGKIDFVAVTGWPGNYICAEGIFTEGDGKDALERRAGIFIGPEFGTVTRVNLTGAAREAAEAGFDLLIACAFSYDAHATGLDKVGVINVLKARMDADLHMADNLKEDSKGNLFVVFGEPDISVEDAGQTNDGEELITIKIRGVDIFNPATGQVQSDDTDGIACWFVDSDYNEESFFVRQAYFLGASDDPYKSLKTTLKAEIDEEAWNTLRSDTSRPFPKPESGRVAVKVINHLGDEAMKVLTVR